MAIGLFRIGLHMQALAVVAELWPLAMADAWLRMGQAARRQR